MIDPKTTVTYAQYNEDLVIAALLHDVKKGFYIDVGANYPTVDSVTKYFYKRGWSGINIEPIKSLHRRLALSRKRDINLGVGLGAKKEKIKFREYINTPGHSTFDKKQISKHDEEYKDSLVDIVTLNSIYEKYVNKPVNFIKIDVEGYEKQVIEGNDWNKNRPEVVCIEANHMSEDWRKLLEKSDYKNFIKDGLNEYYIAKESWWRTEGFEERVVLYDYYSLKQHQHQSWTSDIKQWTSDIKQLNIKKTEAEELAIRVRQLEIDNTYSLRGKSLRRRIILSAKGLTIDWISFKRQHKKN